LVGNVVSIATTPPNIFFGLRNVQLSAGLRTNLIHQQRCFVNTHFQSGEGNHRHIPANAIAPTAARNQVPRCMGATPTSWLKMVQRKLFRGVAPHTRESVTGVNGNALFWTYPVPTVPHLIHNIWYANRQPPLPCGPPDSPGGLQH